MKPRIINSASDYTKDDAETQINLSQAKAHLGDVSGAIKQTQELLKNHSNNPNALFSAALVYTLIGEHQSALVFFEKSVNSGIGTIWFHLPWFKPLCSYQEFSLQFSEKELQTLCDSSSI